MSPLLVGRESECAALRTHLAETGRVILVSGEAGAGKTTLVEHVLAGTMRPTKPPPHLATDGLAQPGEFRGQRHRSPVCVEAAGIRQHPHQRPADRIVLWPDRGARLSE